MECSHDILDVEPSHDRNPRQPHRLPAWFPDDDACVRWLVAVRWPNGFRCPACGHDRGWELKTRKHSFECACCHRQASVAADTLLHRTRLSLAIRFWAACLMATHCNGISALQLQKRLRDRVLSQRLDARRQASPRHGQPQAQPAVRDDRDRRGQPAAARQGRAFGAGSPAAGHGPVLQRQGSRQLRCAQRRRDRDRQDRRLERLQRGASGPVSMSSSFVSIDVEIATLPSCPCSCRLCAPNLRPCCILIKPEPSA